MPDFIKISKLFNTKNLKIVFAYEIYLSSKGPYMPYIIYRLSPYKYLQNGRIYITDNQSNDSILKELNEIKKEFKNDYK